MCACSVKFKTLTMMTAVGLLILKAVSSVGDKIDSGNERFG